MYMEQGRHYTFCSICNNSELRCDCWPASSILSNYFQHDDLDDDSVKKQNWNLFKGLLKDTAKERACR